MPKFFVSSDIHSAYTPWMNALNEAGFDEDNEEHIVIVCGDLFDRMDESEQVYDWVCYMLQHNRLIYILGNHESLMTECIERGYPARHDWSNGTAKSIIDLAPYVENFYDACGVVYDKITPLFNKAVNYFETKNYVFVHGWIPIICKDNLPVYYTYNRKFEFNPDWRNAHFSEWEQARWLNGMEMVHNGFDIEKCVVVGHWHASWGRMVFNNEPEFGEGADFSPYYYDDKLIAIDACTAYTGKVNVLVIEDDFLEE